MNIIPLDPAITHPADGIPNWTLDKLPVHAGTLAPGPRNAAHPTTFTLKPGVVGPAQGYESAAHAIAGLQEIMATSDKPIALAVVEQNGTFYGHEVWSYTQKKIPLEPSTRISGMVQTNYAAIGAAAIDNLKFDSIAQANPVVQAIIGTENVLAND